MTPSQQAQKDRARKEAEHHLHNSSVSETRKENDPFSKENVDAYNKMKFTKDPTGILPDESYEAGK